MLLMKYTSEKLSRVSFFFSLPICFFIGVVYNLSAFIFKFYLIHMRYQIFGIFKSVCAITLIFMHVIVHLNQDDVNVPVFLKCVTSEHFSIVIK